MSARSVSFIFPLLFILFATPAFAQENPFRNAGEVTAADIVVVLDADTTAISDTSSITFTGAGYTHTIGRVSIRMVPLVTGLDENPLTRGNKRTSGRGNTIEYEVYRDLIKERITLTSPDTVRYSYDLMLSDWVTEEPDESRPVTTMSANNTPIISYPHTQQATSYAKDSMIDIHPDFWGNLIIDVNGEDVVVIPRPFAIDATGKLFAMDFNLDKSSRIISITGDLSSAKYPVMIDPTERVTNGGFETGDRSGWVSLVGDTSGYRVVAGNAACPAYEGSYYLDILSVNASSTVIRQYDIYYTGATSVSIATAIPVPNRWDIPVLNTWSAGGNWVIPNPGQTVHDWTVLSATPTLTGTSTIDIWTHSLDEDSTHAHIDSIKLLPGGEISPVANFSATPKTGTAPLMVQFNDGSSGSPTSWSWSFGDGGTSTERNAVHQYTKTGSYTVSLTVSNAYGSNKETKNKFVTVSRSGPAAGFTGTPTSGTPPLRVQFIDTSTGSPVSWLWSFGDGFCNLTTQQNPYHIYTSPGKYTVTLTVKDNKGGSDTEMKIDYVVTSEAPDADFTGTPTSGTAPLSVQFTDMSTGTPTAWAWDFENDGIIDSTLKNPSHTFSNAGTYAISLTATNTAGSNTETKAGYVTVTGPVALTYSMTNSETYRGSMSNLSPMGTGICSNVESVLNSVGWNQQFYHRDFNVTEEDFGTTGSGLVNSVLHYHFGHGNETKGIALVKPNSQGNYPVEPVDYLSSTQVYKKWGSQNKWVILDNCLVLSNASWGDTLSTSHGILGFASIKTPNDQLPATFFHFAMDEDQTVKDAWKNATMNVYSGTGIIAAYRFDTPYQRDHDHLPGHGEVAPDENPDDELSEFDQWMCY